MPPLPPALSPHACSSSSSSHWRTLRRRARVPASPPLRVHRHPRRLLESNNGAFGRPCTTRHHGGFYSPVQTRPHAGLVRQPRRGLRHCVEHAAGVHAPTDTPVWSANRDAPTASSRRVQLSARGLSMTDADGKTVLPPQSSPSPHSRLLPVRRSSRGGTVSSTQPECVGRSRRVREGPALPCLIWTLFLSVTVSCYNSVLPDEDWSSLL
ncbi:hypothetical protein ZWY2020_044651 [Hordeum vulgare]|nr:hypothetical protein ZWY2020_044651 [Hordeum vulgare]